MFIYFTCCKCFHILVWYIKCLRNLIHLFRNHFRSFVICRYSFAIVGINITSLAHQLLSQGHLKTHFYNSVSGRPRLEHFHLVFCKYSCTISYSTFSSKLHHLLMHSISMIVKVSPRLFQAIFSTSLTSSGSLRSLVILWTSTVLRENTRNILYIFSRIKTLCWSATLMLSSG